MTNSFSALTQEVERNRMAADQGDSKAQYKLGLMYDAGQGVSQDFEIAVEWYQLAAEQGSATAQNNLGGMYETGQGVLQDDKAAFFWYQQAAEQGNLKAQNSLGFMYHKGQGVPQNYIQAHKWYNLAITNGVDRKNRDFLARDMTTLQIAQAQQLTREWVRKHGQYS